MRWPLSGLSHGSPLVRSFDVLIQFLCTLAVGDGFRPDDVKRALAGTHAFESVDEEEWRWCLSFIRDGGKALSAYGDYRRVEWDAADGLYILRDRRLARRHRMSIGTIVSDQMIKVRWTKEGFSATWRSTSFRAWIQEMRFGSLA